MMTTEPSGAIAVIRGLGGNGSTYLSRAITAAGTCFVLNECNPRSAHLFAYQLNPLFQLTELEPEIAADFGDFDLAELGSPKRFGLFLDRLALRLSPARRLVVRDYNFADFVSSPLAWNMVAEPSLDAALDQRPRTQVLLVRDPVDQFMSLHRHRALARTLTFRAFLKGASAMLAAFRDIPVVRYEDLFDDFAVEFGRVLSILGLPASTEPSPLVAPLTLGSGNPRGRTSQGTTRAPRDQAAFDALNDRAGTRRLLAEVRSRSGYEA